MFNIGPMELMVILAVALLVVGPKRLPELGKTIGKSLRELRKVQDDLRSTISLDEEPPSFDRPPTRTPQPQPDPNRHRHYFDDDDEEHTGGEPDLSADDTPDEDPESPVNEADGGGMRPAGA